MYRVLFAILLCGSAASVSQAGSTFVSGGFDYAEDLLTIEFSIDQPSSFMAQSFGYGGGITSGGITIVSGGFDTVLSLFRGAGSEALLIDFDDDGLCPPAGIDPVTGGCLDFSLSRSVLLPSIYTMVLTASSNIPAGNTLGDGFSGGASFVDVYGDNRGNSYAFEYSVEPLQATPVPEPTSMLMVFLGLVSLSVRVRKSLK